MPTSLPERRQPEQPPELLPPPRQIAAILAALVLWIGLIASRGPVLAWVKDIGQPVLVDTDR